MSRLSIKFFLRKDRAKSNTEVPVYTRITINRKKVEFVTDILVNEKDWDEAAQNTKLKGKKGQAVDEQLSFIKEKIFKIKRELDYTDQDYDAKKIKTIYSGEDKPKRYIIEYYEEFQERRRKQPNVYTKATVDKYESTVQYLRKFTEENKSTKDILISNVNTKLLMEFHEFLNIQKSPSGEYLKKNTVGKHMSRIRTLLIQARKEGLITKNPFEDFKISYEESDRVALTEQELKKIEEADLGGNESLLKVKDLFLFSVYTGLRFKDAQDLTVDDIKTNATGDFFIEVHQGKTKHKLIIPLVEEALEIVTKYESDSNRVVFNRVLPKVSNQKTNAYLKVIADLCEIDKKLTHHVARHTCATTFILNKGGSYEIVKGWLGHRSIKTSEIYGKVTPKLLSDFVKSKR